MAQQEPSLFDSFNARHTDPTLVGRGFIFNPILEQIARRQHSLVIGPRGSGKTTFLKMLTLPALMSWPDPRRKKLLASLDFVAIYIPSDFSWNADYRSPVSTTLAKPLDELITYGLFRTHALFSMCETLAQLRRDKLAGGDELNRIRTAIARLDTNTMADRLIKAWGLTSQLAGLAGLNDAIAARVVELQTLVVEAATGRITLDQMLESKLGKEISSRFLFDDIRRFCDAADHSYPFPLKWAFCFDELEIAPEPVKRQVLKSFRSFDQRALLKCSSSPFDETYPATDRTAAAMSGHDFAEILLSQTHQRDIQRFGELMLQAICRDRGIQAERAERVLGRSYMDDIEETQSTGTTADVRDPYAPGGAYFVRFRSLAEKDPTFARYLSDNGIKPREMAKFPEAKKARLVRKILGPVVVRDEFLASSPHRSHNSKLRKRSRKTVPDIYSGARAIFSMCEGNPRWLIGILGPLVDQYKKEGRYDTDGNQRPVPEWIQTRRVERTIAQFLALLSSIRIEGGGTHARSVIDVLELVGDFFSAQFLEASFNPEPISSFTIDPKVDKRILRLIGRGINQGAFVLLSTRGHTEGQNPIEGARLRVSHLLAPLFRLPLVTGRPIDLSTIIDRSTRLQSALQFEGF